MAPFLLKCGVDITQVENSRTETLNEQAVACVVAGTVETDEGTYR